MRSFLHSANLILNRISEEGQGWRAAGFLSESREIPFTTESCPVEYPWT